MLPEDDPHTLLLFIGWLYLGPNPNKFDRLVACLKVQLPLLHAAGTLQIAWDKMKELATDIYDNTLKGSTLRCEFVNWFVEQYRYCDMTIVLSGASAKYQYPKGLLSEALETIVWLQLGRGNTDEEFEEDSDKE